MRYKAGHRQEARARLIAAAGRGFRRKGFGGIGVDGLAKEAEVTSGAFYGHFPSKDAAFKETVAAGIEELRTGIEQFQAEHGNNWLVPFVEFYLGEKRTCELGQSCAMQSLSPEVIRADDETRAVYQDGMLKVVEQVAKGLEGSPIADRRKRAWTLLSALSGGVTLARAVHDADVASRIAKAVKEAALAAAS
jgi:AcrR family transcriptional regulator